MLIGTSVRDPEIELLFTDVNVVFAPTGFGIIWLNYFKPVGNGGPFKGRAIRGTICRVREFDHFLRRPRLGNMGLSMAYRLLRGSECAV
jgi:hypothetical protein